ncbi:MAG TPA: alpha/beta fold hydrolase, partial [Clostridia bacterium]
MNLIKRLYKENIFCRLFVKILIGLAALYMLSILLLFLFQDNLIFYPQKLSQTAFVNIKEPTVENIELKVDKTETVRGWFCKNDPHQKQKLILYFGGNAEEVSYLVRESTEIKGWSVALTNYRGYGMSDGKPSEKDLFSDALKIYDYYANRPDIDTDHIVIMGRSLGTGIATYLASQRKAKGVILISPY